MTVKDRELMKVGNWKVRSGHDFKVTPELIKAAVAAHESGVLRKPTIRIGHGDERFSGDPAMGFVDNLRISEDGDTLYGDLLGVPQGFAEIMPSAYPSLSIEGMYDYTAPDGTEHDFVLTGLALLGATAPGISELKSVQDVADFYEADIAAAVGEIGGTAVVIEAADAPKPYGDVKYADPKNGKYPIDTKEHVRAAWSYINMPKNQKGYSPAELAEIKGRIKAAAKRFGITIEASEASEEKGAVVALPEKLAEALGIDASADEDAIAAAWETYTADAEQAKTELEEKVAASAPPAGVVQLDSDQYQNLVAAAEAGQRAEARQLAEDREHLVMAAVRDGRITPASKADWIKALEVDPGGHNKTALAGLKPGLIPVVEAGHAGVAGQIAAEHGEDGPDEGLQYVHNQVLAKLGLGSKGVN
ncbi:hypothetical protein JF780_05760 [Mycobacterium intracellulare]|uniref:DUF6582 domain-containing protein n=1 Tax=Mycobacterium intracellulare TaxID=1767 RepID=UPI0019255778|nr:DUF6582 domain-containing protein [Mycobacterium intracellulare]MCA2275497.1 hypothetical protein [Mycobacterium intracellulare]MCA2324457.1 hypothetical protein [Mycobacterium intracellulare]